MPFICVSLQYPTLIQGALANHHGVFMNERGLALQVARSLQSKSSFYEVEWGWSILQDCDEDVCFVSMTEHKSRPTAQCCPGVRGLTHLNNFTALWRMDFKFRPLLRFVHHYLPRYWMTIATSNPWKGHVKGKIMLLRVGISDHWQHFPSLERFWPRENIALALAILECIVLGKIEARGALLGYCDLAETISKTFFVLTSIAHS